MKEVKRILNDNIKASRVKLIDENGEVLGEMSLQEALNKAKEKELDLMQLKKEENLVVVKMLDFGKFLYKQKKQQQKNKQKSKAPDLKTIKITFKIGEHDLLVKKNQAQKFSQDKHPLKVILSLKGRENSYQDLAQQKIENFINMLGDFYKIDKPIVKNGNNLIAMLLPK